MPSSERIVAFAVGGVLLAASILLLLFNWWDWDVFLTFNEVDRRAWLHDHEAPLWTYQFCGGITRIGDPQSFGLSPLFVIVLLFGSFWGSKLAVILSLLFGLWVSARLFQLVSAAGGEAPMPRFGAYTLATLFVTSNYFMWHLSVGHYTFLSFYLALGIVYYTLAAYSRGLSRGEAALATLVVWTHFSGGFFHSTAYLLIPFYVAFGSYWIVSTLLGPERRDCLRRLGRAVPFHAMGALLAYYKLAAVWRYQSAFPRELPEIREAVSPLQLLAAQALPTLGDRWPLPIVTSGWGVHEWSAFSMLPVVLLLLLPRTWRSSGARLRSNPLTRFVWIYATFALLFALGDFSEIAPFSLVNRGLLGGSIRIPSRFGIGVSFSIALTASLLWRRSGAAALSPGVCTLLLAAALANLLTFSWMASASWAAHIASLPTSQERMNTFVRSGLWIPRLDREQPRAKLGSTSRMYGSIRSGKAIAKCYNALPRPRAHGQPLGHRIPMLASESGVEGACLEESYFTQNQLYIAPSCPSRLCVHVKWLNIHAPPDRFHYDPKRRLFCRGDPTSDTSP